MNPSQNSSGTGYPQNILEQPQAVRDTVAALENLDLSSFAKQMANGQFGQVVLTGMGASYHALHPVTLNLLAHGIPAQRIETSELLYHAPRLVGPRTLVIAVSQSGASAEILRLLEHKSTLIGVTNTPESPLARASDVVVLTHAGEEYSVSSKTYVATLAALQLVGDVLCGEDASATQAQLAHAADAMAQYLTQSEEYVTELSQTLAPIRHLVLAGRGPSLAAVGAGSLIIQEAAHFPCLGMSSAAFRHGPMELIAPNLFVLVLRGIAPTQELNTRLAADLKDEGARAALVQESLAPNVFSVPPVAPAALPLVEILVPEMISLALARLKGHTAGQFERSGKITTTE